MNIVDRFVAEAKKAPERIALVESSKSERAISYEELNRLSAQSARFLSDLSIGKHDTVLVYEKMSINLYAILIGIWRLGAIAMFVDPQGGWRLLDASCRIANPKALVAISKAHCYRFISREMRRIPKKVTVGKRFLPSYSWSRVSSKGPLDAIEDVPDTQSALYTFTSGSTGHPKAANRTHGILLAQHDALVEAIDLQPGEVDLASLPIFTLANLASGLTTVIPNCDLQRPGFIEAKPVIEQINRWQPTRCVASPAFLLRLSSSAKAAGDFLPFKKIYTGGGPVYPKYLHAIQEVVLHSDISIVYGSTEAEPISHIELKGISEEDFRATRNGKGLLVGHPSPTIELRVIEDRDGELLPELQPEAFDAISLETEKPGEIVVSGPHVLTSYLNGLGDEENKIRVGGKVWHRTGDAGYLDTDGRLWLLGRLSSKITKNGAVIYPFSIEAAVSMDTRIAWPALIQINGKVVLALELIRANDNLPNLSEFPLLEGIVDRIQLIKTMPLDKRHNAKIDYRSLYAQLGKRG